MSGKFEEQGIAIFGEPAKPVNGLEKFIGPGATRPEIILQFGAALVASVAAIVYPLLYRGHHVLSLCNHAG